MERPTTETVQNQSHLSRMLEGLRSPKTQFEISKYSFDLSDGKKYALPKITFKLPREGQSSTESVSVRITTIGTIVLENPYDLDLLEQVQLVSFISQSLRVQQIRSSPEVGRVLQKLEEFGQRASEITLDENVLIPTKRTEITQLQNAGNTLQGQLESLEDENPKIKEIQQKQREILSKIQVGKREIAYLVALGVDQITNQRPESVILDQNNPETITPAQLADSIQKEPSESATFLTPAETSLSNSLEPSVEKQKPQSSPKTIESKTIPTSERKNSLDKLKNIYQSVSKNWKNFGRATALAGILQFGYTQGLEQKTATEIPKNPIQNTEVVYKPRKEQAPETIKAKTSENRIEIIKQKPLFTKIVDLQQLADGIEISAEQSMDNASGQSINLNAIISLITTQVDTNLGNRLAKMSTLELQKTITIQSRTQDNGFTKTRLKIRI